ncbi:MAG: hypothetical protein PVF56_12170 [Desulfobacterales bacterium]|jgi:hypothetical protein
MEYAVRLLVALWVSLVLSTGAVGAESQPPPEGGLLPDIVLATPKSSEHQDYLGISGKDTFKIPEIKAEVVIIEIFSMY